LLGLARALGLGNSSRSATPIRSARLEEERSGWLAVILPALSSHHHRRLSTLNARLRSPTPCLVLLCLWPITVHMPFWATWRSPTAMANGGKSVCSSGDHMSSKQLLSSAQPATAGRSVGMEVDNNKCMLETITSHHPLQRSQLRTGRLQPVIRSHVRHEDAFFAQSISIRTMRSSDFRANSRFCPC